MILRPPVYISQRNSAYTTAMQNHAALLVIDVQNDFCPGGALAVPHGDAIVPLINRLATKFETVVLTQDWHPADHISFAANHPGKAAFETITLPYGEQTLWPTHCVMGTAGAALHPDLDIPHASLILRKGSHRHVDSYSAFLEADRETKTGLDGYLTSRGITDIYLCGLATRLSAWPGRPRTRGISALPPRSSKMPAAPSTSTARSKAWERLTLAGVTPDQQRRDSSRTAPPANRLFQRPRRARLPHQSATRRQAPNHQPIASIRVRAADFFAFAFASFFACFARLRSARSSP